MCALPAAAAQSEGGGSAVLSSGCWKGLWRPPGFSRWTCERYVRLKTQTQGGVQGVDLLCSHEGLP